MIRTPGGEPSLNYLCPGLRRFFKRALPEVERIADNIRKAEEASPGSRVPRRRREYPLMTRVAVRRVKNSVAFGTSGLASALHAIRAPSPNSICERSLLPK